MDCLGNQVLVKLNLYIEDAGIKTFWNIRSANVVIACVIYFVNLSQRTQSMIVFNSFPVSYLLIRSALGLFELRFLQMRQIFRLFIFLEVLITICALNGDIFLVENVKQAKLENQKLAEKIQQRLKENDIQQLLKNLTDEETERFRHETEVRFNRYQ